MVSIDPNTTLRGPSGEVRLIDAFEGRSQLLVAYFMWYDGQPHSAQCEGCTMNVSQVGPSELSYLHSRDVTFAVLSQGPYDESEAYRRWMGWESVPWYTVSPNSKSVETLIAGRHFGMRVCYLRRGDEVFETYWATGRGCENMGSAYDMLDMTVYGRQESWEDSPVDWPRKFYNTTSSQMRTNEKGEGVNRPGGRPIAQWPRCALGELDS